MKNKIEDLRNHLFETLEALKDKEKPMDIDRAKAIAQVAGVIIESAKAETRHLEVIGGRGGSGFIPLDEVTGKEGRPQLTNGKGQG